MNATAAIPIGATASYSVTVARELTVAHFHPGMPEVYGTPMMIYLMEVASSKAIEGYLPPGWGSVGTRVDVEHVAATPVGFTVTATATVVECAGGVITFRVEAHDGVERIGAGTHTRAAVELTRFERRVQRKRPPG
ncbi:MAG: thioesterase [Candidatus Rokubacteria bacterium]|nr:thioesterase [Candidatus Rokubacteria bacterium]